MASRNFLCCPLRASGQQARHWGHGLAPREYVGSQRQFIVLAAGGHFSFPNSQGDSIVAYALPR